MIKTFRARLLSDLHIANNRAGGLQVVAVIYPMEACPLPRKAYPAIWEASDQGFKGDVVRVELSPCPENNGYFDLVIGARESE